MPGSEAIGITRHRVLATQCTHSPVHLEGVVVRSIRNDAAWSSDWACMPSFAGRPIGSVDRQSRAHHGMSKSIFPPESS